MEYAIAKMSTKGQLVIPSNLRENMHAGEEFLVIKDNNRIIIKSMNDVAQNLKEDLFFARRVEKAWQEYDKKKFVKKSKKEFLEALRAC